MIGEGELATRLRAHDWSTSPLGDPKGWPQALKTIVALLLQSKFPMFVAWGPELGFLYNDAYAEILGKKHPTALGARFDQIWAEIWPDIAPLIKAALAGEAIFQEDLPLLMNRRGFNEQTWFTFSYSPVLDDSGGVGGMFCAVTETTQTVISHRRDAFRLSLERKLRELADPAQIMGAAAEALGQELRIARVGYGEIDSTEQWVIVERDWTDGRIGSVAGRHRMDDFGPEIITELRAGRMMWVDDVNDDARVGSSSIAYAAIDTRSVLAVPLFKDGRFAAMLYLHHHEPHKWTESETALAREAVEQTWQAVERATAEAKLRELNTSLEQRVAEALAERLEEQRKLREAERAKRESDALYRAYFENAPEALFMVRVEADGNFVAEEINPAHEASVGFPISEIRGKRIEEFMPAEGAKKVLDAYRQVLESGKVLHYRDTFDLHGASQYWDTSIVPVRDPDGRITRLIGSSRNVTSQIVAEEALRQSQKMEAVGQLTGGIAHDFNNLLNAVMGAFDLIRRKPDNLERVKKYAEAGLEAAERGAKLTGQLLAFSRAQRIEMKPVKVAELVTGMRDLLASTLGPMVRLKFNFPEITTPVLSDATQLEMAILNMAINARDAMPEGGDLTIATNSYRTSGDGDLQQGEYVVLSVADTGLGMEPDVAARAFDPFFTTKSLGKGTGLGLSQVYGVARQTGGTVRIESEPGVGTTIRVYLPRTELQSLPPDPGKHSDVIQQGSGQVLVVDDDPDVRSILAASLEALGYQVRLANEGKSGLVALEEYRPDLMVLDFAMPEMNGAEVAIVARQLHPELRILFASGYADTGAIEAAVGPDAVMLRKPFRIDELQATVAAMMSERAAPDGLL